MQKLAKILQLLPVIRVYVGHQSELLILSPREVDIFSSVFNSLETLN